MKPETLDEVLSNTYGLATLTCVLGLANVATPSPASPAWMIIAYRTANYSCCCQTICSRFILCQLIVYNSGGNSNSDSGVRDDKWIVITSEPKELILH